MLAEDMDIEDIITTALISMEAKGRLRSFYESIVFGHDPPQFKEYTDGSK